MHELSVCQALLREVERVAITHNALDVVSIRVAIGPLSGVEPPLLARAFVVARAGTRAGNAALEIDVLPTIVWCGYCEVETPVAANALICGQCGSWHVEVRSGDQLMLMQVELDRAKMLAN